VEKNPFAWCSLEKQWPELRRNICLNLDEICRDNYKAKGTFRTQQENETPRITYSTWLLPPHSLFWCWNWRKWLAKKILCDALSSKDKLMGTRWFEMVWTITCLNCQELDNHHHFLVRWWHSYFCAIFDPLFTNIFTLIEL